MGATVPHDSHGLEPQEPDPIGEVVELAPCAALSRRDGSGFLECDQPGTLLPRRRIARSKVALTSGERDSAWYLEAGAATLVFLAIREMNLGRPS